MSSIGSIPFFWYTYLYSSEVLVRLKSEFVKPLARIILVEHNHNTKKGLSHLHCSQTGLLLSFYCPHLRRIDPWWAEFKMAIGHINSRPLSAVSKFSHSSSSYERITNARHYILIHHPNAFLKKSKSHKLPLRLKHIKMSANRTPSTSPKRTHSEADEDDRPAKLQKLSPEPGKTRQVASSQIDYWPLF